MKTRNNNLLHQLTAEVTIHMQKEEAIKNYKCMHRENFKIQPSE